MDTSETKNETSYKIIQGRLQGFIVMVHGIMQEHTSIKTITDSTTLREQLVVDYFSDLMLAAQDNDLENAYHLALNGKEHKFPNYAELQGTIYYAIHRGHPLLLHQSWLTKNLASPKRLKKKK